MNKKTDFINSKSKKISNDFSGLLKEPSFKLQRNLIEKKDFKNNNISNQKHSYDDKLNNGNIKIITTIIIIIIIK